MDRETIRNLLREKPTTELLPCPFCGSDNAHIHHMCDGKFYVDCQECRAQGPTAEKVGKEEAVTVWNYRHTSQSSFVFNSRIEVSHCPFCGSNNLRAWQLGNEGLFNVSCWECGATGADGDSPGLDAGIIKWNNRKIS